jgi:hypothetical protein
MTNLAGDSKEGYGSKRAVLPMMMMMVIEFLNIGTLNSKHVYDTGHN